MKRRAGCALAELEEDRALCLNPQAKMTKRNISGPTRYSRLLPRDKPLWTQKLKDKHRTLNLDCCCLCWQGCVLSRLSIRLARLTLKPHVIPRFPAFPTRKLHRVWIWILATIDDDLASCAELCREEPARSVRT